MKKIWKILLCVLGGLMAVLVVAFAVLWSWSPGKIAEGEIVRTEIGGLEQGMILTGIDEGKPVLLFLHGGPGSPEYALAKNSALRLEDHFIVCWWEQRGSGMSWSADLDSDSVTLERMLEDTLEVTNYLRERFGQEKIYLMGHSWGSFLGVLAADRHPQLYEAYIGVGQVTNQLESEKLAYAHMMETAQAQGDKRTAEKLGKYQLSDAASLTNDYILLRSATLNKQGNGLFHAGVRQLDLVMQVLRAPEFTLADKIGYVRGMAFSMNVPANDALMATDLSETVKKLDVPVFIIHGVFDTQVSYQLSKAYFEALEAPEKHFYPFENSAHSPFVEEPEKFMRIIQEDLLGPEVGT